MTTENEGAFDRVLAADMRRVADRLQTRLDRTVGPDTWVFHAAAAKTITGLIEAADWIEENRAEEEMERRLGRHERFLMSEGADHLFEGRGE